MNMKTEPGSAAEQAGPRTRMLVIATLGFARDVLGVGSDQPTCAIAGDKAWPVVVPAITHRRGPSDRWFSLAVSPSEL